MKKKTTQTRPEPLNGWGKDTCIKCGVATTGLPLKPCLCGACEEPKKKEREEVEI